ncbi:MAG: protein phosphatase 2C domain-containing protein [Candidatus Nanopelagicales bacterium]
MPLVLRYAARSDVGLVRSGNEDSGYAGPSLLVVADGMGGHAAGELASATVVATLAQLQVSPPPDAELLPALSDAVDDSGASIGDVADAQPDFAGMGTTVTALYWNGTRIAILHVGDSRAYLFRDGELTQITHDHTYVQTLVDAGRITPEEARTHPRRSLIMKAIDGAHPVEPDVSAREARVGDRYLLCSDGLTGVVTDDALAAELATGDPPGTVTRLVELALEGGAPDNVTVVVADVVEVDDDTAASLREGEPVVVGAAGEPRVRARLPGLSFPEDEQPDPDRPDPLPPSEGPPTRPTAVITAPLAEPEEPDEDAYEAQVRAGRRRRIAFWSAVVLGTVGVLAALVWAATSWLWAQYYVGDHDGRIAIYNGVPGTLIAVPLQRVEEESLTLVSALPTFDQELVMRGITASDFDDAVRIKDELERRAVACTLLPTPAGCPGYDPTVPQPTPLPTPEPTVSTSADPLFSPGTGP